MDGIAHRLLPWLLSTGAVLAQASDEPVPPAFEGNAFAKLERDDKLIDLQWRRNANGNLEYAIAGAKDAKWRLVFGKRLDEVMGTAALLGYVAPLLHRGDLLSLTDGEAHFRRLGIATDTKSLATFARAPLGKRPHRIDELDRLVAVDVLAARADGPAKDALARLAADAEVPAEVRARVAATATAPRRERLTVDDLLLPERADVYVAIDHDRLADTHTLLDVARFTSLLSSAMVMRMLKRPLLDDAALGEAEGDATLDLPFELVRRLGMLRIDHSCVSLSWTREVGGDVAWAATAVGSFDAKRIAAAVRGLPLAGFESAVAEERATVKWAGGSASVTNRIATGRADGVEVAPREAFAKQLLRDGTCSVHVLVPAGSKLLVAARLGGLANTTTCELEVTWGDPMLSVETLTMKDDATAAAMPEKIGSMIENLFAQSGQRELLARIGPAEVTVAKNVVTCVRKTPRALMQSYVADWRAKLLADARKGR